MSVFTRENRVILRTCNMFDCFRCHKVKSTDHIVKFKKKTPYQCDKCSEVFKSEHFLEIHKRKIHGEGSATVMCSHCGKEFPTERVSLSQLVSIN